MTEDDGPIRLGAVRWLSPTELLRTGLKVVLAGVFGQYADKREMQHGPMFEQSHFDHRGDGDLWFDFVSDVGDGFNASYSVASLLASDLASPADGEVLPRGDLLIMGGDQVYPSADATSYENRTTRVYAAALPPPASLEDGADRPVLYAIPGNHDWYDGLTAFLRVFAQQEDIGGWRTRQKRSYFALRLSRGWWLLAIDIQLDTYIDKPQLDYFRDVAVDIDEDDSIIICTAVPSWYAATDSSMDRLSYFLRHSLGKKANLVRLVLTGDVHHYARYQSENPKAPMLVTAGIGGAYASAAHLLPPRIEVTARLSDSEADSTARDTYVREGNTWPPQADSRRESRKVLWRLPIRNWTLLPVFVVLYGLLGMSVLVEAWLWTVVLLAAVLGGGLAFTKPKTGGPWRRRLFGAGLGLFQSLPAVATVVLFAGVVDDQTRPVQAMALLAAAVVGSLLTAELLALWLLVVSRWRVNDNELFAAMSIEDYKGFLRCRIDPDGVLTIFPIGLRRSVRNWRRGSGDGGPLLLPTPPDRLDYQLIEPKVTIVPPRTPLRREPEVETFTKIRRVLSTVLTIARRPRPPK